MVAHHQVVADHLCSIKEALVKWWHIIKWWQITCALLRKLWSSGGTPSSGGRSPVFYLGSFGQVVAHHEVVADHLCSIKEALIKWWHIIKWWQITCVLLR